MIYNLFEQYRFENLREEKIALRSHYYRLYKEVFVYSAITTVSCVFMYTGRQSSLNCAAFMAGIIEAVLNCSNFVSELIIFPYI